MTAKGEFTWKNVDIAGDFFAAFVFMDQATQSIRTLEQMRPANTPELANNMRTRHSSVVFAHALVGPADLLVGVKAKGFGQLAETIQGIRKGVDGDNFIHRVQSHMLVSVEGRMDFCNDAFHGATRDIPGMRAWVLATAATPRLKNAAEPGDRPRDSASDLEVALKADNHVKLFAKALGGYDYFIYIEAADMPDMQKVIDQCIRTRWEFVATDTRIVMHEHDRGR